MAIFKNFPLFMISAIKNQANGFMRQDNRNLESFREGQGLSVLKLIKIAYL